MSRISLSLGRDERFNHAGSSSAYCVDSEIWPAFMVPPSEPGCGFSFTPGLRSTRSSASRAEPPCVLTCRMMNQKSSITLISKAWAWMTANHPNW
jgi:hypothetical protein